MDAAGYCTDAGVLVVAVLLGADGHVGAAQRADMSFTYPRMRLTRNFWFHEAVVSQQAARLGINNTPEVQLLPVLCNTAAGMERIRSAVGDRSIVPSSWYRSQALNQRIGGAPMSQHLIGEAVDFRVVGLSVVEAARIIVRERDGVRFDQFILEFPNRESPWIHVSFASDREPRDDVRHITTASRYEPGLGEWA